VSDVLEILPVFAFMLIPIMVPVVGAGAASESWSNL
jgi:hypothetical protein